MPTSPPTPPSFVTLEEVKEHLRVDFVDSDPSITLKMYAATKAVTNYLENIPTGWDDPENVTFEVKAACLLIIEALFDNSGSNTSVLAALSSGDLNNPVVALLYPLRMLRMA